MKVSHLLAAVAILGMASFAMADKGEKGKGKGKGKCGRGLRGKIVKVEGTSITIKTGGKKESKEIIVATDAGTAVTIDRKEAQVSDLKAGMIVAVTPETGTATKIMARTRGACKEGRGKGKGKGKNKDKDKEAPAA